MVGAPHPIPASGQFVDGAHRFPVRVYFEDTDVSGVVYHANYLRYMERARSDMLRQAGIDQRGTIENGGGYYAIADITLRYIRPALLDDDLVVLSRVRAVRAASCVIDQSVWRGAEQLTSGAVTAAFLSAAGRPQRQPAPWLATFHRLASGEELPS
ncbi:MAG TPA: YbgC/FadM family acyl-CoA thioesterase [Sphingobium sp.]|nr:YbgC/FadM family acyl-CoA thioesterase [Sphingobium sp.]